MNPTIQRYLPPALVLGAAAFFGWPPSEPLDLGDDLVRASSVKWRPADLETPPRIALTSDPFEEVLVAKKETVELVEKIKEIVPTGPTVEELKAGLRLDGFADMAGRHWAVVNGRPRLPGDTIRTNDTNAYLCQLETIQSKHIVVRCEGTAAEIHLRAFGSQKSRAADPTPAPATEDSAAATDAVEIPPPPQA